MSVFATGATGFIGSAIRCSGLLAQMGEPFESSLARGIKSRSSEREPPTSGSMISARPTLHA